MLQLIPASLHRAILPWAHRIRSQWRKWAKPQLRGVSVILQNDAGEVLLQRHSYGRPLWSLPGGGLSKTEDPAAGARRELHEELRLEVAELSLLGELDEVISAASHHAYVFHARTLATPNPDQREVLEARFFALDRLPDAVGQLTQRRLELFRQKLQQR